MDKVEIIEEEERASVTEHPIFELGLKKKRIMRSNSSQAQQHREFTVAPQSRRPRIISQEALNAFAYGAMSNPTLYAPARTHIPPPAYDHII